MSVFVTLGTFRNVCLAVREVYPEEAIDALLIADTPESVKEQYESERNQVHSFLHNDKVGEQ